MSTVKWNGAKISAAGLAAAKFATRKIAADIVINAKAAVEPLRFTNHLKQSIGMAPTEVNGPLVRTKVGILTIAAGDGDGTDPRGYWKSIEYGRPPGKFPPPGSLDLWVLRKLRPIVKLTARIIASFHTNRATHAMKGGELRKAAKADRQAAAIRSIAYLVARKIARVGSPAHPFFRPAFNHLVAFLMPEFRAKFTALSKGRVV